MPFDTTDVKWNLGRQGEDYVRAWLKQQGFWVVPTALIDNGGAPMLEGHLRQAILPDLQAFGDGSGRWVEVKTKSRATQYRATGVWEHGMPLRHWNAYREVEQRTGLPAWLAIVEVESNYVLLGQMSVLAKDGREYHGTKMPGGGESHIFFPRDKFDWYPQPVLKILALKPVARRTIAQKGAPSLKQLEMDVFNDGG